MSHSIQHIKKTMLSTKKTEKITRAMELVSASKLHKSQALAKQTKPYAHKIVEIIGHMASSIQTDVYHPYLEPHAKVNRVGILLISTDRGLCGNLNSALFKKTVEMLHHYQQQGISCEAVVIGRKGKQFLEKLGVPIINSATDLSKKPNLETVVTLIQEFLIRFLHKDINKIVLCSNVFKTTLELQQNIQTLLPINKITVPSDQHRYSYEYEPNHNQVLDYLLNRYIETTTYQALIENIACEHAARMIAMKNATENANKVIQELTLAYNKARQSLITKEIAEIVSGANAIA